MKRPSSSHPLTAYSVDQAEGCLPCQQRAGQTFDNPDNLQEPVQFVRWSGIIGIEGELTGDGRLIEPEALRWDNLPIPLRYVKEDVGAHANAVSVGRIDTIERRDRGVLWAAGDLRLDTAEGQAAFRDVKEKLQDGVSMDLDDVSFEIRVASELLDRLEEEQEAEVRQETRDGDHVVVAKIDSDDEVQVTTDGRIRAATIVSIPAFARAKIALDAEGEQAVEAVEQDDADADANDEALAASAALPRPPRAWFTNPRLTEPTGLTVTEDGRVYGHLALWGTCHVTHSHRECIQPPRSASGYAYFHTGSLLCEDGSEVSVGRIAMETTHAPTNRRLSPAAAMSHYENTGLAAADVVAGDDEHGIWVSGALRTSLSEEQRQAFRASPLSGDWRRVHGHLELVAALAVNVPGFPVPRPQGLVASGQVQALVASGMVAPETVREDTAEAASLSDDDLSYLRRLVERERASEERTLAATRLRDRTRVATMAAVLRG